MSAVCVLVGVTWWTPRIGYFSPLGDPVIADLSCQTAEHESKQRPSLGIGLCVGFAGLEQDNAGSIRPMARVVLLEGDGRHAYRRTGTHSGTQEAPPVGRAVASFRGRRPSRKAPFEVEGPLSATPCREGPPFMLTIGWRVSQTC